MESKKIAREIAFIIFHTLPFIYLLLIYNELPGLVPTHFNISGVADDYSQRSTLIWILLALNVLGYLLFLVIPKIDPKKFVSTHQKIYLKIRIGMSVLFVSISLLMIYMAHGDAMKGILILSIIISGLSIFLGNYLQAVRPNYFIGIRTPWTLNEELIWNKTHLVTGRLMFYGGLLALLVTFFIPREYALVPALIVLVGGSIFGFIYSFILYKKSSQNNKK